MVGRYPVVRSSRTSQPRSVSYGHDGASLDDRICIVLGLKEKWSIVVFWCQEGTSKKIQREQEESVLRGVTQVGEQQDTDVPVVKVADFIVVKVRNLLHESFPLPSDCLVKCVKTSQTKKNTFVQSINRKISS